MEDLKKMYEEGGNIMRFFREDTGKNDQNAILYSYDMQSGSYTEYHEKNIKSDIKRTFIFHDAAVEMTYSQYYDIFGKYIAGILDGLKVKNFLEAGIGEATSACGILKNMKTKPDFYGGLDLSLSRIMHGNKFASEKGENIDLAAASLFNMPFEDNSIDCALTINAIEPNSGREEDALKELYRVAARYVVMLEPDYGLGNDLTKSHIEKHGYI